MGASFSHRRADRYRRGATNLNNDADKLILAELCGDLIQNFKTALTTLECLQEEDNRKELLKKFPQGGEEFFSDQKLESLQKKHIDSLGKFKITSKKFFKKKLRWPKMWKKVSEVLPTVAVIAIGIISVVVAMLVAHPFTPAVLASVFPLLGTLKKWLARKLSATWESYYSARMLFLEEQEKLAEQLHAKGDTVKKDLDDIKTAFDKMKKQIIELLETSGGMDERKMEEAEKSLKALVELFDKTVDDIKTAETVLLMLRE